MTLENAIRILAGSFILTSLLLSQLFSPWWLLFTAFVGLNLIQSAFTGFCPAEILLKRWGVGACQSSRASQSGGAETRTAAILPKIAERN